MDTFRSMLSLFVEDLRGRAGGPLKFRLIVMPNVVSILAIRAGPRDAREGNRPFLWALLTNPAAVSSSVFKDIGKVIIMAIVLDTTYQFLFFRACYPLQVLFVAVTCAIAPYVLIRGPVT
jgi:hypothetical protein